MRRLTAVLLVFTLLVAACGDDSDSDGESADTATDASADDSGDDGGASEGADGSAVDGAAVDDGAEPADDGGDDMGECELDPIQAAVPSIGRTGSAAVDTGLVPEGLDSRAVGLEIRQQVEQGELCAEDLIAFEADGTVTDAISAAIEAAVAAVEAAG